MSIDTLPDEDAATMARAVDVDVAWARVEARLRSAARHRRASVLAGAAATVLGGVLVAGRITDDDPVRVASDGGTAVESAAADSFGAFLAEHPVDRPGENGATVVTFGVLGGATVDVAMSAPAFELVREHAVVSRGALACADRCGTAEVVAEYRPPSREVREIRRFERSDGLEVVLVDDGGIEWLRYSLDEWVLLAPTTSIPPEAVERWATELVPAIAPTGWITVELGRGFQDIVRSAGADGARSGQVELGGGSGHLTISAGACDPADDVISDVPNSNDDGQRTYGTTCVASGVVADAEGTHEFVEQILSGLSA